MKETGYLVGGALLGSVAAYLCDPVRGRSRRTELAQRSAAITRRLRRRGTRGLNHAASQAVGLGHRAVHLQVEDRFPTDERLKARVETELFRPPDIPKGDINVNVEKGALVLRGHVASETMRNRLEHRARRIQGVDRVENLIRVDG